MGIYHFIPLIQKTARVFFVIIGGILIIQNLGYSVGSLLAGLVYYFTRPIAWAEHLRVREEMNLAIMGLVEKWDTSIAFPTRTLYFQNEIPRRMGDEFP